MYEILRSLPPQSIVLDLGSGGGSFPDAATQGTVIRLDRTLQTLRAGEIGVRADARFLPLADNVCKAVIANHSLEHFDGLNEVLREIGRVLDRTGALFVSVPDASTLTDRLYRWLARGGGHVNAFTSPSTLAAYIAKLTGLRHLATQPLCSSLSFLNRSNSPRPIPLRLLPLGAGYEWSLFLYNFISRRLDRLFGLRTSEYGWAFYFGSIPGTISTAKAVNVCLRCGAGTMATDLRLHSTVRRSILGIRVYECVMCNATNPYSDD
jgi:SAM-dependent methyltransferase